MNTNLEFDGKVVHIASIFVVRLRVPPDEADFFFKCDPSLEIRDVRWRCTAVYALRALGNALQRDWMPYNLVIVLKSAGWQVAKRRVDFETPVECFSLPTVEGSKR